MIRFITDSTFGITEDYAVANKIKIVNLKLILDDNITSEGFEKDWAEFYERLSHSKNFPTTSQPSPDEFIQCINDIYAEDKNAEIIILTIASGLSGTINGATLATKSFEGKKIVAIDSQVCSSCGRIMIEEMVDSANAGKSFEEIVEQISQMQLKMKMDFIPDTMEYLKRGGRVNKIIATIASILKIKPILTFKQNIVSVSKRALGMGKAITDLVMSLPQNIKKMYVCYIHDDVNVPKIVEKLKLHRNIENVQICSVSPVFGSHVGIGAIGIASLEA